MTVLNNVIKVSFSLVGAVTGYTLTKTLFVYWNPFISSELRFFIFVFISILLALTFYSASSKIINLVLKLLDSIETSIQKLTLVELVLSAIGLIVGLIVANLIAIPINKIDIIGVPVAIFVNVLFGCIGMRIIVSKKNEDLIEIFLEKRGYFKVKGNLLPKVLDTSVIIDGRIVDICRSGFLEGELVIPDFILDELRHIADSEDPLRRNRGRRGLDVLDILQKDLGLPVRIEKVEIPEEAEVDIKLLSAAKKLHAEVITNDYNLNKVAKIQNVPVLNINELSNALKPIALPGENMRVQVIKDGKENGQGVGYLDDGTMIVVDGGKKHMGELVEVTVTSVLQTAAGRMIFAKSKNLVNAVDCVE